MINQIKTQLAQVFETIWTEPVPFQLETPPNRDFGDFSTNVAFLLAKQLRKSPKQIAEDLCETLNTSQLNTILSASPLNGFINLKLNDTFLWQQLSEFNPTLFSKKTSGKINLEYVSANPTGPLHIGHGRWAVLGSAIRRLLETVGYSVSSEFYINDAGVQIQNLEKSVEAVRSGKPVPENGYMGAYIHEIANSDVDPKEWNLLDQKRTLAKIDTQFDTWFSEQSLHDSGEVSQVIEKLKTRGCTYESENALWFRSTDFGDEKDRVLIKSDGSLTYFVADIAYHLNKVERGFSKIINIWGADHHGYIPRVRAGLIALLGDQFRSEDTFRVVLGQLVTVVRNGEPVRMSKRAGNMVTFEEIIDEIGPDAVRYFLIEKSPDSQIEFDLELAKKQSSENPVYYVQYSYARICSILRKSEVEIPQSVDLSVPLTAPEKALILHSLSVKTELEMAADSLSVYHIATYLLALARTFHHFYETCPILKAESNEQQLTRLKIVELAQKALGLGLDVLGVRRLESM